MFWSSCLFMGWIPRPFHVFVDRLILIKVLCVVMILIQVSCIIVIIIINGINTCNKQNYPKGSKALLFLACILVVCCSVGASDLPSYVPPCCHGCVCVLMTSFTVHHCVALMFVCVSDLPYYDSLGVHVPMACPARRVSMFHRVFCPPCPCSAVSNFNPNPSPLCLTLALVHCV